MDIKFEIKNNTGLIILNRPKSLNALNLKMAQDFALKLDEWKSNKAIHRVLLIGEGNHFCAGGDVKSVHLSGNLSDLKKQFFLTEYKLNLSIYNFPKPYLSIWKGVVMGGGVGLSLYGDYRVVTNSSKFAMPETAIGFFPDVGGSFFLSRLNYNIGVFLGLTGHVLNSSEMLELGLATHYCPEDEIDNLVQHFINSGDIKKFKQNSQNKSAIFEKREIIDKCFAGNIKDIFNNLKNSSLKEYYFDNLIKKCPMSLAVTVELLKKGKSKSIKECLEMEYKLSQMMVNRNDFAEGIESVLIKKHHNPNWSPKSIDTINLKEIDDFLETNTSQIF